MLYADEAYQFSYSETFCKYAYEITIYRKKQTITLHSAIYEQTIPNDTFHVTEKSDKQMSLKQWSRFTQLIRYSDFWNTAPTVEQMGFDGNYLEVDAIVRSPFDSSILANHFMKRRFVDNTCIYSAYNLLLNMTGTNKKCNK